MPLEGREPRPQQAPPGAAARKHSSIRLPEPSNASMGRHPRGSLRALVARARPTSTTRDPLPFSRHDVCQHQDHRYGKLPPVQSGGDDAFQLVRVNRGALARLPGSRNDALEQQDPRALTRRSFTVPIAVATVQRPSKSRRARRGRSDESTISQAAAVSWSASAAASSTPPSPIRDALPKATSARE